MVIMSEQIWKQLDGYESLYEISSIGSVKSFYKVRGRESSILRQYIDVKGYLVVTLLKNKARKTVKVHRLVAESFIPNPENKPQVNHINGTKTDNRVENLEWATNSDNQKHAFKTGLQTRKSGSDHSWARRVGRYGNGVLLKEYPSLLDAVKEGFNQSSISRSASTGIRHRGFHWKYHEPQKRSTEKMLSNLYV
jgi:hypothetical protein